MVEQGINSQHLEESMPIDNQIEQIASELILYLIESFDKYHPTLTSYTTNLTNIFVDTSLFYQSLSNFLNNNSLPADFENKLTQIIENESVFEHIENNPALPPDEKLKEFNIHISEKKEQLLALKSKVPEDIANTYSDLIDLYMPVSLYNLKLDQIQEKIKSKKNLAEFNNLFINTVSEQDNLISNLSDFIFSSSPTIKTIFLNHLTSADTFISSAPDFYQTWLKLAKEGKVLNSSIPSPDANNELENQRKRLDFIFNLLSIPTTKTANSQTPTQTYAHYKFSSKTLELTDEKKKYSALSCFLKHNISPSKLTAIEKKMLDSILDNLKPFGVNGIDDIVHLNTSKTEATLNLSPLVYAKLSKLFNLSKTSQSENRIRRQS